MIYPRNCLNSACSPDSWATVDSSRTNSLWDKSDCASIKPSEFLSASVVYLFLCAKVSSRRSSSLTCAEVSAVVTTGLPAAISSRICCVSCGDSVVAGLTTAIGVFAIGATVASTFGSSMFTTGATGATGISTAGSAFCRSYSALVSFTACSAVTTCFCRSATFFAAAFLTLASKSEPALVTAASPRSAESSADRALSSVFSAVSLAIRAAFFSVYCFSDVSVAAVCPAPSPK